MQRGAAVIRSFALAVLFVLGCVWTAEGQTCTLSVTSMTFGTYSGTLLNGSAAGKVTCAGAWNVPLNAGTGAGATETVRKMTGPGGATLSYQVFQDAARSINWGNTASDELTGTGNANITFYGQIPAGQVVAPGTYTDTLNTATATFQVTAVIQATCTIAANPLAFGNYSGVALNATTTIFVNCTKSAPYNVGLNAGTSTGSTVTNRHMTGPASTLLNYTLFSNSGRTTNWGNTVGTDTVAGTGNGVAQSLTIYGQIPAGQLVRPGSYTDTITATLTY
jgi:spore coat protein U-like protein